MGEKNYRAAIERFDYIFDQLEQLKIREMDRLEELNGAGIGFQDGDDNDMEMDNDNNATNKGMKKLDKLYKSLRLIARSWLSLVSIPLGMILNSSRSICSKNYANMVSNQPSLSRNQESIPVSRLNT